MGTSSCSHNHSPDYSSWSNADLAFIGHMSPGAYNELVRRLSDSDTYRTAPKVSDSDTTWAWTKKNTK